MKDENGKVILLGGECVGHVENDIGYAVLAKMLQSLAKRDHGPKAIICWNTAVKLLAEGSPVVRHFKNLEERGIDIVAGKSCVEDFELMGKIAVGRIAALDEVLDLMFDNNVLSL